MQALLWMGCIVKVVAVVFAVMLIHRRFSWVRVPPLLPVSFSGCRWCCQTHDLDMIMSTRCAHDRPDWPPHPVCGNLYRRFPDFTPRATPATTTLCQSLRVRCAWFALAVVSKQLPCPRPSSWPAAPVSCCASLTAQCTAQTGPSALIDDHFALNVSLVFGSLCWAGLVGCAVPFALRVRGSRLQGKHWARRRKCLAASAFAMLMIQVGGMVRVCMSLLGHRMLLPCRGPSACHNLRLLIGCGCRFLSQEPCACMSCVSVASFTQFVAEQPKLVPFENTCSCSASPSGLQRPHL